ncbi:hypothetical protein [Mesorhizobium sp.]|jgi:hypothetical protein|nr:hypothetical protein [Mesorhizobium sp.]
MPPALLGKPIAAIGGVVLADRRLSGENRRRRFNFACRDCG